MEIYLANAFGSTFAFLPTHKANQKCKRATKQTHQNTTTMDGQQHDRKRATSANSSLAKWRVTCFYYNLVLNQNAVLRLNFCAKIPPLRQAAKRWQPLGTFRLTRNIIALSLFYLTLTACGQTKDSDTIKGLTIDPSIKKEVEKHIETSKEYEMFGDKMQVYLNSGFIESFQNDSLIFSSSKQEGKAPFKSFYLWKGDTLTIDGAFGLFGGIGFGIDIYKNNAILYHMLSSDDFPSYAYKESDSLIFRLEVPCTDTKIILSEIPDSTKKQIIYGYIEFKSGSYFASSGSADGQEILPRQKLRNNMKLYFKAGKLDF